MTRLLTCGYETGDVAESGVSTIGTNSQITAVNTAPTPRAGAYCLRIGPPTSGSTLNITYKSLPLPAAKTDLWVRFAVLFHPAAMNAEFVFAASQDTAGGAQNCLTWDPSSGAIRSRSSNLASGTLHATSSAALSADAWHVVEWRIQITSATTGTIEVWLDGTRVINFTGDNTQSATANVQFVSLGAVTALSTATGTYLAFDDLAVNDTAGTVNNGRVGDGRVVLLVPSGAGSSTVLARGGTDTGANYSQVNEIPPSLAQYVGSSTAGDRDLYAMGNLGVAVSSINVVEAIVLAQNSDAGAGQIAPTIRSGGTTNEATAIGLGTSAGYVTSRWEVDPNTSAAWTSAAVDAVEAGVTVR